MNFRGLKKIFSPLLTIIYQALSWFLAMSSYFKNEGAICKQRDIIMPPITFEPSFVESVIGLSHFSGKYLLLLICSYIKPCLIALVGLSVGFFSKIGGVLIFALYAFICGLESLGKDFYLILLLASLGILATYLNRINNKL